MTNEEVKMKLRLATGIVEQEKIGKVFCVLQFKCIRLTRAFTITITIFNIKISLTYI